MSLSMLENPNESAPVPMIPNSLSKGKSRMPSGELGGRYAIFMSSDAIADLYFCKTEQVYLFIYRCRCEVFITPANRLKFSFYLVLF
mmetsp:Transcript_6440/g.8179  ORF Transcript_6440/g.8179 Transcript_6440/m.8179 type:complete len:87 (-) Transcript_6440:46-306(-)